ncbi:MAG: FAD-binding oxidoreductase, partial [Verrucomicrobia bacterium]|nr:FAD-binding oxidoreductase [Verrucomicrobiota bacterium]
MKPSLIRALASRLKRGEIRSDAASLESHAQDKWFARHLPDAVALPRSRESVIQILQFAHQHRIPLTPRGAGHGYVGGCVPV